MNEIGTGTQGALLIIAIAVLMHEPWRWLGLVLGQRIDVEGRLFQWVRAVATALLAGLVMRLILFPAGDLAQVSMAVRLAAFTGGIAAFYWIGHSLAAGVAAGAALLVAGAYLIG